MSTITPPEPHESVAPPSDPSKPPVVPPVETAPSGMVQETSGFTRLIGFVGLTLLILGVVVVAATKAVGPRWVPEGWGFMFGALGIVLLLYHSSVDGDVEIRRTYGGAALFLLIAAIAASLVPGPFGGTAQTHMGYYLLPWGVCIGLVSLLFFLTSTRHETDPYYRNGAVNLLLVVGALLAVGCSAAGIFRPEFLAGPGVALSVLGLGFICAFFARTDTSEGTGYTVAFSLGAFGALLIVYVIFRTVFPTLLYEGSSVLRRPNGELDTGRVLSRLLVGLIFLVPAVIAFAVRAPLWLRVALGALGATGLALVVVSLASAPVTSPPTPFFIPAGLILIGLGALYLCVSVGICSDNQIITLTRRELSSYFLSPIGYLVLVGTFLMQWCGYWQFVEFLERVASNPSAGLLPEPILENYFFAFIPVVILIFIVPALTMRLLSEEMKTGSLEVLLTAPVNEWPIVVSKFLGAWIFYMFTWLPAGLLLIALRLETGVPFDYRPLLSYYLCLAAQGFAFIGMGLFFSSLSKNQIVAAVLTFAGMMVSVLCFFFRNNAQGLPTFLQTVMNRLAFPTMWGEALSGRLPVRDVMLYCSIGAFWLFLSAKILETRKWS
jgi:ABC-type transport system involved in multi-copper enzyme maturation permease subunit